MLNVINYVNHTSNKPIEYDLFSHLFKKLPRKKKILTSRVQMEIYGQKANWFKKFGIVIVGVFHDYAKLT